tara:strand:+ start:118 stop:1695 length:1578 start_codon:yes stop_codon:yes gene_type:complete
MKQTFVLILISITFSCSSIKFNNEFLTSSNTTLNIDFDEIQLKNWYNLDLEQDSIPGMSVERAYNELIKDIKPKKVIVAVIDAGIDIYHEDLKDVIWLNKGEIPNNKIDDDNNGYIDDINGWNFLGESYDETLEITRLIRDDKTDNPQYKDALNIFNGKVSDAKKDLDFYRPILENYKTASDIIKKHLKVESFEIDDIKNINSKDMFVSKSKEFLLYSNSVELDLDRLEGLVGQYSDYVNYYYNVDFNGREIVGDDIYNLEDLNYGDPNVVHSKNSESHGTHVSGIIGGNRSNGIGMKGINNDIELMAIRAVPNGDEYDKDISLAIRYAVDNGAKIINMSFGKSFSSNPEWVYNAIKYAEKKNVLIVHAAGNDDKNLDEYDDKNFPNDHKYINEFVENYISVGASTINYNKDLIAYFSNYGQRNVDIYAPGYQIYSTTPNDNYDFKNGTSMAAPSVTGVASLILSYFPKISAKRLKEIILESGIDFNFSVNHDDKDILFENLSKSGKIVNAYNALILASGKKINK